MRLAVIGDTPLAEAIRHNTAPHFAHAEPEHATVIWHAGRDIPDDIPGTCPVLLSSPWPVGTCMLLEARNPGRWFAVSPENVREAHAIEDFRWQPFMVLGLRHWKDARHFQPLLAPFTNNLIAVDSPESAEMVKHALNAYLAATITFGNEIADVCKQVGADPLHVIEAIRADPRVAGYLIPGDPVQGHLRRDVTTLQAFEPGPLLSCL